MVLALQLAPYLNTYPENALIRYYLLSSDNITGATVGGSFFPRLLHFNNAHNNAYVVSSVKRLCEDRVPTHPHRVKRWTPPNPHTHSPH